MSYNPDEHELCLTKPIEPYITEITFHGKQRKVLINPKNPQKHELLHILDDSGYLFHNLWKVVQNPDNVVLSTSKNPIALNKNGRNWIFSKHGFIGQELGMPGYIHLSEDMVEVVVLFEEDETKIGKTQTYHIFTS